MILLVECWDYAYKMRQFPSSNIDLSVKSRRREMLMGYAAKQ